MGEKLKKFTDDEIRQIYEEEYIGQHIGARKLGEKYNTDLYYYFKKLGLEIRSDYDKNKKYQCNTSFFS